MSYIGHQEFKFNVAYVLYRFHILLIVDVSDLASDKAQRNFFRSDLKPGILDKLLNTLQGHLFPGGI